MKSITSSVILAFLTGLLGAGCASVATPQNTSALKISAPSGGGGSQYQIITVMPFQLGTNITKAAPRFGENFAGDIVGRLRTDYEGLFQEVRWNKTDRVPNEAILEGIIRTYKPGSAEARSFLIGLGTSSFEGEVILRDAQDGRVLLAAPFDKLWAWGGALGGSKSIENMQAETAVAITKTIALWKQGKLNNK